MVPRKQGKREKVECPVPGCKKSAIEGGIDVRGLKTHLMSNQYPNHNYDSSSAMHAWEQATGRKSRGRPAKKRAIEYVERDPVVANAPRDAAGNGAGAGEATAWFQKGFEAGIAFGRKMAKE
jgi:hypothetical protein